MLRLECLWHAAEQGMRRDGQRESIALPGGRYDGVGSREGFGVASSTRSAGCGEPGIGIGLRDNHVAVAGGTAFWACRLS